MVQWLKTCSHDVICVIRFFCAVLLRDLATVIVTKANAVKTNQESTLLLDTWLSAIVKTTATATRFMRIF